MGEKKKVSGQREPTTWDEIAAHNLAMIKLMRDNGLSAAVIHAVFVKNEIGLSLAFVEEMTKPGVIEELEKSGIPRV